MPPKTTRIKAPSGLQTEADFHKTLSAISKAAFEKERLELEREQAVQLAREKNSASIAAQEALLKGLTAQAQTYAEAHRVELLGDRKTGESGQCFWGWRLGNRTLKTLRGWTWERVIDALRGKKLGRFIVETPAPDKEKMKAELDVESLAAVGCHVVQAETFFIEPKRENPDGTGVRGGKGAEK